MGSQCMFYGKIRTIIPKLSMSLPLIWSTGTYPFVDYSKSSIVQDQPMLQNQMVLYHQISQDCNEQHIYILFEHRTD